MRYSNYKYAKDFSDIDIKNIIEGYVKHTGILSIEMYVNEIGITKYMYNKLLQRYRELYPNNKVKPEPITVAGLIGKRGWTKSMAKKLLKNIDYKKASNPYYYTAASMKLYNLEDIKGIEKTKQFEELKLKADKRKASAKKAMEIKRKLQEQRALEYKKRRIEELQNEITKMIENFNATIEEKPISKKKASVILTEKELNKKIKVTNIEKVKWQEECNNLIENKNNVILSSPTGSGKTLVYLKWALSKKQRPIYITAPIKALSNQRYRELKQMGYTVGIETGDIKNVPELCDFICCTQEIYTNKYVDDENTTLIIDEFHYIFENSDRTRTYIDGLRKSKAQNILICSATLGNNIQNLERYIDNLTNREFYTYVNNKRLTELKYNQSISKVDIKNALVFTFSTRNCQNIAQQLIEVRKKREKKDIKYREENQLKYERIKSFAKDNNINLDKLKNLDYFKYGISTYYGALLPYEKQVVEQLFENKLIDIVVGTDALALGVNFPVENVVFAQLNKQYKSISKNLFEQLAGRAGRKGFFDIGQVYYCNDLYIDYDINQSYQKLLNKELEDFNIKLEFSIGKLLKREITIENEIQYICNYSTVKLSALDILEKIHENLEYINTFSVYVDWQNYSTFSEHSEAEQKVNNEFNNNIANVYFDEYDIELNCEMFSSILLDESIETIIEKYDFNFNELLQFRRYLKQLPRKYRKNRLKTLEKIINDIDNTALTIEE